MGWAAGFDGKVDEASFFKRTLTATEVGVMYSNGSPDEFVPPSTLGSVTIDDSTTANKHYAFTRSGSTWTIYQDGVSKGTFTDATRLGSGTSYSMNIGGTVDE